MANNDRYPWMNSALLPVPPKPLGIPGMTFQPTPVSPGTVVPFKPLQDPPGSAGPTRGPQGPKIGPVSQWQTPNATDPFQFAQEWQRNNPASADSLAGLYDALKAGGFNVSRPTNASGLSSDKLVINGQMIDLIRDVGGPNMGWQWGLDDGSGGGGGGAASTAALLSFLNSGYSDPDTQNLIDYIHSAAGRLGGPMDDTAYNQFAAMAGNLGFRLQQPWTNPNSAETLATLQRVLQEVSGDPYTSEEWTAMRTDANDEMTRTRDMDARTMLARMAQLGHGKGSGTIAEALRGVEDTYQQNRAANERQLQMAAIGQKNANRNTAVTVSQLLRQIPLEDEQFATNRAGQAVAVLKSVADAEAQRSQLEQQRMMSVAQLLGIPVQIGDQRLMQALQVLGLTGGSGDMLNIINTLGNLSNSARSNSLTDQANNAAFWNQVGAAAAGL